MINDKKHEIAIIVGGRSTEFDASILSYENIITACNDHGSKIKISTVFFLSGGILYVHDKKIPFKKEGLGIDAQKYPIIDLPKIIHGYGQFVLNLLHGNEGEDGSFQGIADVFDIDGSFGNVLASALTMNKWQASELATVISNGKLTLIPYLCLNNKITQLEIDNFLLNNPGDFFVIKPNSLGASLFTEKIKRENVVKKILSINKFFEYDRTFLLQKYIKGREFTVGVVQKQEELIVLPIIEAVTRDGFLGHIEKHRSGHRVTAHVNNLEDDIRQLLELVSKNIFKKLEIRNFCRFDFILAYGKLYFLEVNTIPGIMKQSAFTKMLSEKGIPISTLISWFIDNFNNETKINKDFRYRIDE